MEIIMNYKILFIISLFLAGQIHAMKRDYQDFSLGQDEQYDQSQILDEIEENPSKLEKLDAEFDTTKFLNEEELGTQELLEQSRNPAMLIPLTPAPSEIANTEIDSFQCFFCQESFFDKKLRNKHYREVHQKGFFYYCPYPGCQYKTNRISILVDRHYNPKHLQVQEKPFKCLDCEQHFSTKRSLDNHMSICSKKSFTCPNCKERYGVKKSYTRHCNECCFNKPIESTSLNLCSQSSNNRSEKADNEQSIKRWELDIPLSSAIDKPMNTNQDNQQPVISTSEADSSTSTTQFSRKKQLECPYCDLPKKFSQAKLAIHISDAHKGNLPFPCFICLAAGINDMGFKSGKGLNTHNNSQHENIRYQCTKCNSIYYHRTHARDHVKRKHPEISDNASLIKQTTIAASDTTNQLEEQHLVSQTPFGTEPFTPRTEQILDEVYANVLALQSNQNISEKLDKSDNE
jgi:hypothetical protein